MRELRRENRERSVRYPSGNYYTFSQSWHTLDNGDQYHYIHVYRNGSQHRPWKHFSWAASPDGTFLKWVHPASWNEEAR